MSAVRATLGWTTWLVPFIPAAVVLDVAHAGPSVIFFASALGVIPTASLMGRATEELADALGPGIGGLLNVTFGNAPELIIALFALEKGLHEVVKASLVGSILGNVLLVLGASMFVGGLGRDRQRFDRTAASAQSSMLLLAAVALTMPAIFELVNGSGLPRPTAEVVDYPSDVEWLSFGVALVLIGSYVGGLVFSLKTHRDLFNPAEDGDAHDTETWSVRVLGLDARARRRGRRRHVRDPRRLDLRDGREHRPERVLHRRDHRRDRRQRRRALGGGPRRLQGQDGPGGQHRHRLERPDRPVRGPGAGAAARSCSARTRCRWSSTASSSGRSCSPS